MSAIRAIWKKGKIVPSQPVDWPEGSELIVEPLPEGEKIGLTEAEWRDDPEGIAQHLVWLDSIEPIILTDEETKLWEEYRIASKKYNLEAVRKKMEAWDGQP